MKKTIVPGSGKPTANEDAKATIKYKENLYCEYMQKRVNLGSLAWILHIFLY